MDESGYTVLRWQRYGKNRLYVTRADGSKLGWYDLAEHLGYPEQPEDTSELAWQVGAWLQAHPETPQGLDSPSPVAAPPDEQVEEEEPWEDLSLNVAGAAVRKKAIELQQAAPVRTFIASIFDVKTEERAWRIGAQGEELVAAELARLKQKDPRWHFLHSIPVGKRDSDIDHFIAGPNGFYTVNTKHHPNADVRVYHRSILVNGSRQQYIRNSVFEADRASLFLSELCGFPVPVEALLVMVNAGELTIKQQPEGVTVVPHRRLAKWLQMQPELHEERTILGVMEMAKRSTTWTRATPRKQRVTGEQLREAARFDNRP